MTCKYVGSSAATTSSAAVFQMRGGRGMNTIKEENGNVFVIEDLVNDDWIRAARLRKRAEQGDRRAAQELELMREIKLIQYEEE